MLTIDKYEKRQKERDFIHSTRSLLLKLLHDKCNENSSHEETKSEIIAVVDKDEITVTALTTSL